MELERSTAELIESSTLPRSCSWAPKAEPVPRIEVRLCTWAPTTAQNFVRMLSLACSTPARMKPADLSGMKAGPSTVCFTSLLYEICVCLIMPCCCRKCVWSHSAWRVLPHILGCSQLVTHESTREQHRVCTFLLFAVSVWRNCKLGVCPPICR